MNAVKKKRVKTIIKYTWPLYIGLGIVAVLLLRFIFSVAHRTPAYKTLTVFVSGEVIDAKKMTDDVTKKYESNELKEFSYVSANPNDYNYRTMLTASGYNYADILIIHASKLVELDTSSFALELSNELISSYYQGYSLYQQDGANYGIKVDKEKVKEYMTLPNEDCFMLLNAKSENLGEYSKKPNSAHNNALNLVKDWGM